MAGHAYISVQITPFPPIHVDIANKYRYPPGGPSVRLVAKNLGKVQASQHFILLTGNPPV